MHGPDVVGGVAPIAHHVQVPEPQLGLQSAGDPGRGGGDLAGHEPGAPARRLVVVEDDRGGEDPVAAPVELDRLVGEGLGHAVGGDRAERRGLILGRGHRPPEDLGARRLEQADRGPAAADGLEQAEGPEPGHVGDRHRVVEGGCDRGGGGQVVDLLGPRRGDGGLERGAVGEEPLTELDGCRDLGGHDLARHDQPVNLVPLREEQLAEVGTVLAGDPGDQGATVDLGHGPTVAAGPPAALGPAAGRLEPAPGGAAAWSLPVGPGAAASRGA